RTQLSRFETEIVPLRKRIHLEYRARLQRIRGLELLRTAAGVVPHIMPVLLERRVRDRAAAALAAHGVRCAQHYRPGYEHPFYHGRELPGVRAMMERQLTLPLHHRVSPDDIARIGGILEESCAS